MTDKKYVVPDGMMDAASRHCDSLTLLHASLEAAIRWLAENPIMPTMDQLNEMFKKIDTGNGGTYIPSYLQEWQRMMFLSPEPNTSRNAKTAMKKRSSAHE